MKSMHPPTTPFVCAVSVTGHRRLTPESLPAITKAVSDILAAVRQEVTNQLALAPQGLYSPGPPLLRCISPLAEGADRIVAGQALEQGYVLQTPLPFLQHEYEKDFPAAASKQQFRDLLGKATAVLELDGTRKPEGEAYLAAGRIVLEHSDLLIAVWDGAVPNGIGGTGHIVAEAEDRGLPVVIIDPAHPAALRFQFPGATNHWGQDLNACIGRLILPPAPLPETNPVWSWKDHLRDWFSGGGSGSTSPAQYFAETRPGPTLLGRFPAWFEKTLARKKPPCGPGTSDCLRFRDRLAARWKGLCALLAGKRPPDNGPPRSTACAWCDALGFDRPAAKQAEVLLAEHYEWADQLAVHYAALYRAVGFLRHLLMAVVLVGVFIGSYVKHFDAVGFGIQVLAFALILLLIQLNAARNWHQRFLDYRFIAEELRHMRFLFLLGCVPASARNSMARTYTRENWPAWHLRNIARQAGLVPARMEPALLEKYRQRLDSDVLTDQINFYDARKERYGLIADRLSAFGIWCFIAGLGFIALRFVIVWLVKDNATLFLDLTGNSVRVALNQISLVIPSVASMAFALRAQGEYATLSTRYAHTREDLQRNQQALQAMVRPTRDKLANFSRHLAALLTIEVSEWHGLVKNKTLRPY
ncbi:hypothetical protein DVDV_1686 [Desulfovibrio sp. DV]|uniref:hypothetical protein n=1 Tax=Desulfovibrio sp. DV TaxID=1844708 RepID=UPI00094BA6C2|nr:hypothetical protein [Desulfovibrio sp. DV]OLN28305.1 hypothetical protein DVDV_1686 [Desulfovibrio sp. DV]